MSRLSRAGLLGVTLGVIGALGVASPAWARNSSPVIVSGTDTPGPQPAIGAQVHYTGSLTSRGGPANTASPSQGGGGGGGGGTPPVFVFPSSFALGPNGQTNGNWVCPANITTTPGCTWVPNTPNTPAGPGAPSAVTLAVEAANRLALPTPAIHTNPDSLQGHSPDTVVNFSTWLWLDPGAYRPVSVTASAGGVSATTTATPTGVVWDMGDANPSEGIPAGVVNCNGPGTPWSSAVDPSGEGPDPSGCEYTYHYSTDNRPPYIVTATISYDVSWRASTGQGGTLPGLQSSSTEDLNVDQIESVITSGG